MTDLSHWCITSFCDVTVSFILCCSTPLCNLQGPPTIGDSPAPTYKDIPLGLLSWKLLHHCSYGGFHKWWYPQMDGLKWMDDLGLPIFQKTSIPTTSFPCHRVGEVHYPCCWSNFSLALPMFCLHFFLAHHWLARISWRNPIFPMFTCEIIDRAGRPSINLRNGYGVVLERAKLVVLERAKLVVLERGNLAIYIYIHMYMYIYIYIAI